jgi:putative intracellular protease/amidase
MTTGTVHVAVFDTFADWELGYATAHILRPSWQREPGRYSIATVGPTRDAITTMGGLRVTPDIAVDELDPAASAMLVLAGGDTWGDESMAGLRGSARRFLDAGVPVAAICGATFGLALEGLLDDRPHTSNAAEYLGYTGYAGAAHYIDQPVVVDGGLITAASTAPVDLARAIFDRLGLYEPAVAASWFKLYGDRDPVGFYELMSA